jgi:hypothetical protein
VILWVAVFVEGLVFFGEGVVVVPCFDAGVADAGAEVNGEGISGSATAGADGGAGSAEFGGTTVG